MNSGYNNPLSVTSQFSFCGLPFRMDTYAGCAFNCTYCFARLRGGNISTQKVRAANPDYIITRFKNSLSKIHLNTSIISEYIRRRMPVHFGGMSDPFQPLEKSKRVSLKVLNYLCSIQYPTIISTKSILPSFEPYLPLLKSNPNVLVQFSLSTIDDENSLITEPYSTKPSDLFKAIEKLSREGIKTAIRWQPYIPNLSEDPGVFIQKVINLGIRHLSFEHLKLPLEKNNPLVERLCESKSFNIKDYYKHNGCVNDGRELVLPPELKIPTINLVRMELKKRGITFGAADNEIQYLSDTFCCCSGADQFEEFTNWNKFQIAYAIKKSNNGNISFDLIKNEWRPTGSLDKHLNSKSRIEKKEDFNTIYDYILDRWQNLSSPFNPSKFYKVRYSGKNDPDGIKIYEWIN